MSPAAVYVHWKAKHDLLFELSRIGHQAVLEVVEQALEQASDDPVERVHAFVSAFATWHAENHALARVIQYEFKKLPRRQFRQIVEIRDRFEELMRDELAGGVAAGVFDVADLEGTMLAVLSLCIDLARWYEPSPGDHNSAETVGELYAEPRDQDAPDRPKQALGLVGSRAGEVSGNALRRAIEREVQMEISCAFPTALDSPDQIALAEELGYERAWLYDTPQQSTDVWVTLALAAERTERIGLGPGVLVPSLRHPMVNAAATANLAALAPGRVAVAFGTGFTGRRAMGYRAIPWTFMDAYIRAYRGLLRGETIEWEGARMRMLHPPGHGAPRPVEVPIIIGALGPKGAAVARELGDGLYITLALPEFAKEFSWVSYLFWGTIRDEDEDAGLRARARGGRARAGRSPITGPTSSSRRSRICRAAPEWKAVVERTAPEERHLAVHEQHCVGLNEADQAAWDAGGHQMLDDVTISGTADQVRERLAGLAEHGVTEIVFQPCGPDIRRELEVFMDTAKSAVAA